MGAQAACPSSSASTGRAGQDARTQADLDSTLVISVPAVRENLDAVAAA